MKLMKLIIILIVAVFFQSCASRTSSTKVPVEISPGDSLFARAEAQFNEKQYDVALTLYEDYIALYPEKPLTPLALLKIAAIFSAKEDYGKARNYYEKIVSEYPDSHFAKSSRLEILETYYHEGNFNEVLFQADSIRDDILSDASRVRKFTLMGDSYLALGSPREAVEFFLAAYNRAKGAEQKSVYPKIKENLWRLTTAEVETIINHTEDTTIRGHFVYQLGLNYAKDRRYGEALAALTDFIVLFPAHEETQNVKNLIEELNNKIVLNHKSIGCLLPLSGRYEAFGNNASNGIKLALERFKSNNSNSAIEIFIEDTGDDPEKAAQGVKKLSDKNVAAIIGPIISSELAAQKAQEYGIPMITLTQKEQITEKGGFIFRNFLTPQMQVKSIVSYAIDVLGLKRFAVLYPNEKYGNTFMNLFWDEVLSHKEEIVAVESYNPGQTDFADSIKKLAGVHYNRSESPVERRSPAQKRTEDEIAADEDANRGRINNESDSALDFDAIFIPDGPEKSGLLLPQLVYHDVKNVHLLGTNLWHSKKLLEMAKDHIQGAIMPEIFFAESLAPEVTDFVSNYESAFGEKPGFIQAIAYDTAMILLEIISRPDIQSRLSIKEVLRENTFQGVTGPTSFDSNGDALKKLQILQIRGDGFVEVENQ